MCVIRVFCCDCSLRSAAIVAAVLNAVVTALFVLSSLTLFGIAGEYSLAPRHSRDVELYVVSGFAVLFIAFISLGILLSLIRAIDSQNGALLVPWLIGDMINIVIQFVELIASLSIACMGMPVLLPLIGFQTAYLSFEIYLWIVILNYYKELRRTHKNPPPYANLEQSV